MPTSRPNHGTTSSRASSTARAKASPKASFNRGSTPAMPGKPKGITNTAPRPRGQVMLGTSGLSKSITGTGSGPTASGAPKPSGGGVAFPGPMSTYSSKSMPRFNKGTGKKK